MAKWSEKKINEFVAPDGDWDMITEAWQVARQNIEISPRRTALMTHQFHGLLPKILTIDHAPMWITDVKEAPVGEKGAEVDGPQSNYWTQPIPSKDKAVSSPSEATKAKLRAKRKKRK